MLIDIWSDVVCPFCYIGKRHLEMALKEFAGREQVKIRWHSFELDPQAANDPQPMLEILMKKYQKTRQETEQMMQHVKNMGKYAGLDLRLEQTLRVNSLQAHRLIHLASDHGLQDQAVERLMSAYFTEGENLSDEETLARLMDEIGLPEETVRATLESNTYTESVRADEHAAQEIGIGGVPFFLFNERYAISGAQPVEIFTEILERCAAAEKTEAKA